MPNVTFEEVYANAYVRDSIKSLIAQNIVQYPMLKQYCDEFEQELLIRLNSAIKNYEKMSGSISVETFARRVLEFAVKDFRRQKFAKKAIAHRKTMTNSIEEVETGFDNSAAENELRMDVESVIALLPPLQQEICRKIMRGDTLVQIAADLKIPLHVVRMNHIPDIRRIFLQENLKF